MFWCVDHLQYVQVSVLLGPAEPVDLTYGSIDATSLLHPVHLLRYRQPTLTVPVSSSTKAFLLIMQLSGSESASTRQFSPRADVKCTILMSNYVVERLTEPMILSVYL